MKNGIPLLEVFFTPRDYHASVDGSTLMHILVALSRLAGFKKKNTGNFGLCVGGEELDQCIEFSDNKKSNEKTCYR